VEGPAFVCLSTLRFLSCPETQRDNFFASLYPVPCVPHAMREHSYFVYIVASRTHVLYIGITNHLRRRVWEHKNGIFAGFTSRYQCHRLVWAERYASIDLAIAREKQLKNWSRAKKIVLIERENPTWADRSEGWYTSTDSSTLPT